MSNSYKEFIYEDGYGTEHRLGRGSLCKGNLMLDRFGSYGKRETVLIDINRCIYTQLCYVHGVYNDTTLTGKHLESFVEEVPEWIFEHTCEESRHDSLDYCIRYFQTMIGPIGYCCSPDKSEIVLFKQVPEGFYIYPVNQLPLPLTVGAVDTHQISKAFKKFFGLKKGIILNSLVLSYVELHNKLKEESYKHFM